MEAPKAIKKSNIINIHNQELSDDYHWLRDMKWPNVQDADIINHLKLENKYTDNYFEKLKDKKEQLFQEMKSRIKLSDQTVPIKRDQFFYYSKTLENKEYPIFCRKFGSLEAAEEIILDQNELAEGKKFLTIGSSSVSPDHKFLAYSIDESGSERYTIHVMEIATRIMLTENIPDTIGNIVWHENLNGFFYIPCTENWRHDKILFHKIGEEAKQDQLIYQEYDPIYSVGITKSSSKDYLIVGVEGYNASEHHVIAMNDETMTLKLILARQENHFYTIDHNGDYFYIHTNDKGKNFRLARASVKEFRQDKWEDFISQDNEKYLKSFDITQNFLILNYKNIGLPHIEIVNLTNKSKKIINFPDVIFLADCYSTNFKENDIRVDYSSLKRPDTIFKFNTDNASLETLKIKEVPSGFNADEYEVERIWADSSGVKVPISIVYKKSLFKKDGSNPLYLYGYGAYGISIPVNFRTTILSLLDRGFVYAIGHIRGGDDMGFEWYESAKFLNKKNTFNDFIACTEKLISEKYTSKGNIVIMGGSAGGMLIGAVVNARPELYKAAIAHVPFVDVLYTMLDEDLPLTPLEFKEWGNPKDKEYFNYILSYSPYNNVKKQAYPHLFVTASISDPRVGYWEAAKWVAELRDKKTNDNLLLFKVNMEAGHKGASGRFDYLKDIAEETAFILNIFGIREL